MEYAEVARTKCAMDLPLPTRRSDFASGYDLHANVTEPVVIAPGKRAKIPAGITIAPPAGFEAQIRPRSGLALRHGVTLLNAPGTIDADYRGEISALLINLGEADFTINRGDRIAQMVFAPVANITLRETANLPPSKRGAGGFGSTGIAP